MELRASFFEKFYRDHFYPAVYMDEHKEMPTGDPGSDIWMKRVMRNGLLVHLAPYHFGTGRKYYYDLYQSAINGDDIWINNVDYFKALLFVFEADKRKYPIESKLSFKSLFDANKKHKGKQNDAFSEAYFLDTLEDLHCLFTQKNLPGYIDDIIERKSRRKLTIKTDCNSILEILDKEEEEFLRYKIGPKEKEILYEYFFNVSKPVERRKKVLVVFSIHQVLSTEEIANLIYSSSSNIFYFVIEALANLSPNQNDKAFLFFRAFEVAISQDREDVLIFLIHETYQLLVKSQWLLVIMLVLSRYRIDELKQVQFFSNAYKFIAFETMIFLRVYLSTTENLENTDITIYSTFRYWAELIFSIWLIIKSDENEEVTKIFNEIFFLLKSKHNKIFEGLMQTMKMDYELKMHWSDPDISVKLKHFKSAIDNHCMGK